MSCIYGRTDWWMSGWRDVLCPEAWSYWIYKYHSYSSYYSMFWTSWIHTTVSFTHLCQVSWLMVTTFKKWCCVFWPRAVGNCSPTLLHRLHCYCYCYRGSQEAQGWSVNRLTWFHCPASSYSAQKWWAWSFPSWTHRYYTVVASSWPRPLSFSCFQPIAIQQGLLFS